MKSVLQLFISTVAAGGLLVGAASHATNLAELPLKASVLAKPAVIFAMDESGSMDAEVMIDGTFQGWFYGNYNNATLYPGNAIRTGSANNDWPLFYLFPDGTGAGNRVYGDPNAAYGYAIPPTNEVAWTRSSDYNTLYYNSTRAYVAWSPAYVNSAYSTYSTASSSAAKSHPALGTTTVALSTDLTNTSTNWKFTFLAGMTIPAGATNVACFFNSFPGTLPYTVATDRGLCTAALTYYPATFWKKETCTVNGSSCITNYDNQTLKRYEIKSGNTFPSGRTYAAEMENFANWFTYYRKRRLMLGAAMGQVLENISGLRMGVIPFNVPAAPTMYDADNTAAANNRFAVTGKFYAAEGSGGTPTHAAMAYAYSQFDTNTNIVQYACQRNSLFVITDGFANDAAVTPPTYSQTTYGTSTPYQTIAAGSLADKALAYFTLRMRATTTPLPAGKVPLGTQSVSNPDPNINLHLTTYALTLGLKGTIWPNVVDPFITAPTWPAPVSNTATMIDDLWHATLNGRGKMYSATTPEETALQIRAGLDDILSQEAAQGGVAVSAVNLDRSDSRAYLGVYNPRGWTGDLTANPININTAVINSTPTWAAATRLAARGWSGRVLFSSSGNTGVDFSAANVGAAVNPNAALFTNQAVVDYLRGSRSGEGTTFRQRSSLIGAVVNAEPVLAREEGMVYLASGDGMLHAFDTATGDEQWAYAPQETLAAQGLSVQRGWVYKTLLDATPAYARLSSGAKMLVGGLGAAGRSYYALDVSAPRGPAITAAAAQFKWAFPAASDAANLANMGYTVGKPIIARTAADGDIVLVTSGYDNGQSIGDGKGRLWVLNASTGAVIKTFRTTAGAAGAESGLAQVAAFRQADGTVRYVYGGDVLGNVWRFDLQRTAAGELDAELLATLKDSTGNAQPVTATPELATISGRRVVLVGTGRLLDIGDFGSALTQSFYAIADDNTLATLANARNSLVAQVYTRSATPQLTTNPVNWATNRGWYFDLPAGEQANTDPIVTYGAVGFVTNVSGGTDCSQQSYLYLVDIGTGSHVVDSTFVSEQISANANSSRVITLRVVDGSIISTTHRSDGTLYQRKLPLGQTISPSKNAWKEIRR